MSPSSADRLDRTRGASFVGREQEIAELKAALEDAISGKGRLVMLVGEPGIGKTRTATELAEYAEGQGVQVLWGRCHEEPGAPPYWPWVQAIRSYVSKQESETLEAQMGTDASVIAEMIPEVKEKLPDIGPPPSLDSPEAARFRLFDSVTSFLKNAGSVQPILLILDNLHWAGKSCLLLLEFLARELKEASLLVVGTYRDVELSRRHPLSATLGNLTREGLSQRVLLRGLDSEEVGRLVKLYAGVTPRPELVEVVHTQTEGNPFFVTEVAGLLLEEGELATAQPQEGPRRSFRVPEGVREAIGQHLDRLSERCNQVLTVAAIIGREFDLQQLERLVEGLSREGLLGVLEEALSAHVIDEAVRMPGHYRFNHVLVQHTLADELSLTRRVRLHARIGEELEELYGADVAAHASEIAYHFGEAEAVLGPTKLVEYSLLAGEKALAAYAHEEALAHFERGLAGKEGKPMDIETADLLFGLGRAKMALSTRLDIQQAIVTLDRALDHYIEAGDRRRILAVGMATVNPIAGNTTANEVLARCLSFFPPDSYDAGRLLSPYAWALVREKGDFRGAQEALDRALAIARREHDALLEMRALTSGGGIDINLCRWNDSIDKGLKVAELAKSVNEPYQEAGGKTCVTVGRWMVGQADNLTADSHEMVALAEKAHYRDWLVRALSLQGAMEACLGKWETGRRIEDRALALSPRDPFALCFAAWIEYQTGRFTQGDAYLALLEEAAKGDRSGISNDTLYACLGISLSMYIARDCGPRIEQAEKWATSLVSLSDLSPSMYRQARVSLAHVAVMRGDGDLAGEQYVCLEPHAGTALVVAIDRLLGLLAHTTGQRDRACHHFEDALVFCRRASYRPEVAWTSFDYAEALLRGSGSGDCEKAMKLLDDALSISGELGMHVLAERAATLRERVGPRPVGAPTYPAGLSQREVEVLRLIALGKRNQEIAEELMISFNTVAHHVTSILNKTGASNRTEAVAYAYQQGLVSR